jgi:hypothetical protein
VNDDELQRALYETFPTLDTWRDTLSRGVVPDPGSELAADDEEWPYAPASTLAAIGLASAREHLHAVRLLFEAGQLFPAAVATLCRSALIGASLATWMLEPDLRRERLRRSLSLALEDYKQHIKYGKEARQNLAPESLTPSADEQLERLELRRSQVLDLLANVGGPCAVNLSDDVIPTAFEVAVPNAAQRAAMTIRWRSMSGAAHALVWHYFGNDGTTATTLDAGGVGQIAVAGDLGRLVMDYFPAYHVATGGWRLLARRSQSTAEV